MKHLADYAKDKLGAIFVDFYDPDKIRIAIKSLVGDPIYRREMAREARRRVETEFTTLKMAENLASVFTRLNNV